ncbi:MAG: DinB family protein [Candidatus Sulfotelmatobacter sp.]
MRRILLSACRLLEALSGEALTTPVDFIGLRNDPAGAYLNIAIRNSVHHRGQLSTYLRARGAKVPAIYVESAAEPYPPSDGRAASGTQSRPAF